MIALRTELDTTVTSGWVDAAKARQTLLTTMCVPIFFLKSRDSRQRAGAHGGGGGWGAGAGG